MKAFYYRLVAVFAQTLVLEYGVRLADCPPAHSRKLVSKMVYWSGVRDRANKKRGSYWKNQDYPDCEKAFAEGYREGAVNFRAMVIQFVRDEATSPHNRLDLQLLFERLANYIEELK